MSTAVAALDGYIHSLSAVDQWRTFEGALILNTFRLEVDWTVEITPKYREVVRVWIAV